MTDVHSRETRSFNMSKIKGKNTKPELIVRKYLHSHGFRYKLYDKNFPGKPDIVLPKYRTVIFINGCFWHGHEECKYFVVPKTRTGWWLSKIQENRHKDEINYLSLQKTHWNVIVIWECELKKQCVNQTLINLIDSIVDSK